MTLHLNVSGEPGSGKTTLLKLLEEKLIEKYGPDSIDFVKRGTSRSRRPGEWLKEYDFETTTEILRRLVTNPPEIMVGTVNNVEFEDSGPDEWYTTGTPNPRLWPEGKRFLLSSLGSASPETKKYALRYGRKMINIYLLVSPEELARRQLLKNLRQHRRPPEFFKELPNRYDCLIPNNGTPEEAVEKIMRVFDL